jgi:hypothetical protein
MSHIFSITSKCENQQHQCGLLDLIHSIKKFHPNSEIVVVDSDSTIKNHFDTLVSLGCYVEDIANKNYEGGAMWHTYEKYSRDSYIFLQDSMIVGDNLEQYFNEDIIVIAEFMGWDFTDDQHKFWTKEEILKTGYSYIEDKVFRIVTYNSMIIKRNLMSKLYSKNLNLIKPTCKIHSESMERIWGMCLFQEGVMDENNKYLISPNKILKYHVFRQ